MTPRFSDIVTYVTQIRPEWDSPGVYAALKHIRDEHPTLDTVTIGAVALKTALDTSKRTPGAMKYDPALTGGAIAAPAADTSDKLRPSLHPDLSGPEQLCAHGLDERLRTSDGRPRCTYCRGVTRQQRNGSNAASRVAANPPAPSNPRRGTGDAPQPGDPELWGDIAGRLMGAGRTATPGQYADLPQTWGGDRCWRHPDDAIVPPYDECAACLDERHAANEWRESRGLPVQPPVMARP